MARSNIIQIGRGPECDIRLQSAHVSARHAIIYAEDGILYIEDNQSSNGTKVNGQKISGKTRIDASSAVVLGDTPLDRALVLSKITYGVPTPLRKEPTPDSGATSSQVTKTCKYCGADDYPVDAVYCHATARPLQGYGPGQESCPEDNTTKGDKINWYLDVMKKYAVGNGRARRKEYWMFILFNSIILFTLAFGEELLGGHGIIAAIYNFAVLIPTVAVGVRRMHDTDHSGWWLLFPIVNLVFAVTEGTRGNNRFGSDPKAGTQ